MGPRRKMHQSSLLNGIQFLPHQKFGCPTKELIFINDTLTVLANDYRILHKPTVEYSPWANGTVESLMRTVLAALRSIMLELKLAPQDWKDIITSIQTIINSTGLERLGKNGDGTLRSPLKVMT